MRTLGWDPWICKEAYRTFFLWSCFSLVWRVLARSGMVQFSEAFHCMGHSMQWHGMGHTRLWGQAANILLLSVIVTPPEAVLNTLHRARSPLALGRSWVPPTGLRLLLPRGSDETQLCRRCLEAQENLINSLSSCVRIEP